MGYGGGRVAMIRQVEDKDHWRALVNTIMKSTVFLDITPCNALKVNRCFGGTYRLHLHGRISRAKYQRETIAMRT
jgi:hypothetical protein